MGRCHEFGSQIREGCGHPMRAGEQACACPECGVVCHGQFDGCPDVWARGPRPVTLTVAPAIAAPRVRALAAGPDAAVDRPADPAHTGPAAASAARTNGSSNGYAAAPPPPPPPPPPPGPAAAPTPPRTEILQWFESAFDEVRNEVHAVVSAVTRQQALLAELLDSRDAELRVVMVAEALPELAGEAAAKALADQSDGLADVVGAGLADVRASVRASEESGAAVMDAMRELLRRVEVTAEINAEEARLEGAARLESLKASVGRQLRPVSAAVAEVTASLAEAEAREAARTKALKAAVARQLQPLAEALEAAVERSDRQMAEISARLDALGGPKVRAAKAASPAPAPAKKKAAPAKSTPAAKPRRPKATAAEDTARPFEPDTSIVYDYDAPPAPAAPVQGLLARRRTAPRRPPLG